jgi:hypothetical protein
LSGQLIGCFDKTTRLRKKNKGGKHLCIKIVKPTISGRSTAPKMSQRFLQRYTMHLMERRLMQLFGQKTEYTEAEKHTVWQELETEGAWVMPSCTEEASDDWWDVYSDHVLANRLAAIFGDKDEYTEAECKTALAQLTAEGHFERVHVPVSLSTLILQKIEQHPDGILMRDITAWLDSIGDPRVAGKSEYLGRNVVSNALSLMKSKQGLVENRDGEWFRKSDSHSAQR